MKKLTDKYFVTGHPIGHSLSPVIHGAFLEDAGIEETYGIIDIEPDSFPEKLEEFKKDKKGFNVTIPHKIAAFNAVDFKDDYAEKVGAVNTVKIENGKLYGYNTDGTGFIRALEKKGVTVEGKKICIIGAGGAVNSVAVKMHICGAREIIILSRRKEQAQALCEKHGFGVADSLENFEKYDYDILVNATPVGMHPNVGQSPVKNIKKCEFVYDLIYNPAQTEFLKMAQQQGIKNDNGLWMLVYQAAETFKIWTGVYPTEKALEKAYSDSVAALEKKNIVLTGFMGVGKSTTGRIVAKKLGVQLLDTDEEIEKSCKMTISEIFAKYGEEKFREIETKVIKSLSEKRGCVISCGGGVVKSKTNMDYLKRYGKIVNLYASVDKIIQNIGDDTNRPLIYGKNRNEIEKLMQDREEFYKNCDLRIDVTMLSPDEAAEEIIKALK